MNKPTEEHKEPEESEYPGYPLWMSEVTKKDTEEFCIDACKENPDSLNEFRSAFIEMAGNRLMKHKDALRILLKQKVLGGNLHQRAFEDDEANEGFRFWQAGEHCIAAMMYGGLLARKLGCDDDEVIKVEKACLLHDAGKPEEIKRIRSGGESVKDAIDGSAENFKKQLTAAGLSGVFPLVDAIMLYSDGEVLEAESMSEEQKIVSYVDMILDTTALCTIEDRLAEDADHWKENYRQTLERYEGESLRDRFKRTGSSIEKEFAESLGVEIEPNEFPNYCREMLAEEVREYMAQSA